MKGEIAATAWKRYGISPIGWRPSFEVQAGDLFITLETQRLSSLQYNILISSNIVGSIARKGRWFPKWPAFVECTPEVPELVQLFCFWLAMQSWRVTSPKFGTFSPFSANTLDMPQSCWHNHVLHVRNRFLRK